MITMLYNVRWATGLALLITLVAVVFYSLAKNPARFGHFHDDGIYAVTAKALATGQGYRILSLPDHPAQTKYPPFYPFLLSIIWRVRPDFPENLTALLWLSVITAGLALILCYGYLVRRGYADRGIALIILTMMAFNWRILYLSGGLYTELLYLALSILALWFAERYLDEGREWLGVATGVFLGLTCLTRTIGITLVVAVGFNYLIKRQYRKMCMALAVSTLFIIPWFLWQHLAKSPTGSPTTLYYTNYIGDFRTFVTDVGFISNVVITNLPFLLVFTPPALCWALENAQLKDPIFLPLLLLSFALMTLGYLRSWRYGVSLPGLYMVFYFGILLLWPYPHYDRFLIPLLPFLMLFMLRQLKILTSPLFKAPPGQGRAPAVAIGILCLIASTGIYSYGHGIFSLLGKDHSYVRYAELQKPVLAWVRANTLPDDIILCYSDPLVYLHTGRHTMRSILSHNHRGFYTGELDIRQDLALLSILGVSRANYLLLFTGDFEEPNAQRVRESIDQMIAGNPGLFELVYETSKPLAKIYRVLQRP